MASAWAVIAIVVRAVAPGIVGTIGNPGASVVTRDDGAAGLPLGDEHRNGSSRRIDQISPRAARIAGAASGTRRSSATHAARARAATHATCAGTAARAACAERRSSARARLAVLYGASASAGCPVTESHITAELTRASRHQGNCANRRNPA
jgi:hypothetical protein